MQALKTREEIPTEYTWDLQSIFPSDAAWEQAFQSIQQRLPQLEALKGTLAQSGQALLAVLQKRDELFEELERLYVYSSLRRDEDTANGTYQAMADRAMQLFVRVTTTASFIEPEILALSQEKLDQFMQETPGLAL